jgi:D-2-hydroxyacid dehydrogenase (NADP+)
MTHVLIVQHLAEDSRRRFEDFFREKFPELKVTIVTHHTQIEPHIGSANVLMSFGKPLGPNADKLVAMAPQLKWIQSLGTGVDNLADLPSLRRDVIVTSMHGIHGAIMSEAALTMMLALSRDLPRLIRNQEQRIWERWPARLLDKKTVGIFGIGAISKALAPRCRALGMRVVGITSSPREVEGFDKIFTREQLLQAVREIDYLVLLIPYSAETHHIVGADVLAGMKPDSYLINLARGGIVDEMALVSALNSNKLAGAALDVFSIEPLPKDHPLWTATNVLITPHVGGYGDTYDDEALTIIEANMRCFLAGDTATMINIVARS